MRTTSERLEELEERIGLLERTHTVPMTVAYEAVDAALQNLRDNRAIKSVQYKLAMDAVRYALTESLSHYPQLLDQLRHGYWPRRFKDEY